MSPHRCPPTAVARTGPAIPLPALDPPGRGGWRRGLRRLLRRRGDPAKGYAAGRPGPPAAAPERRDDPFLLTEEYLMPEPEMTFANLAASVAAPAPEPERPAPAAPSHRHRPSQPATLVPVTNGYVLVIGGAPVAVAGTDDEQLAHIARDWARGAYGG